jgi:hypothetical protein
LGTTDDARTPGRVLRREIADGLDPLGVAILQVLHFARRVSVTCPSLSTAI